MPTHLDRVRQKWGAHIWVTPELLMDPEGLATLLDDLANAPDDAIDPVVIRWVISARDQDPDYRETLIRVIGRAWHRPSDGFTANVIEGDHEP